MNNLIPEGWEQNKLGKYVGILGGNAFKSEAFTEVGIPVVRISNIKKDGSINLNSSIFTNEDASFNRFKVQYGDILIAMSGATTGKVGRYALNNYSYLNQRVGKFFAKRKNDVSMDYIHQVTAKDSFVQSILIDAIGGAQPNISNQQIESIIALFPPLPEQQKIAAILTSVDEVIEKTQAQIDKLKDLKSGMMQELLTKGVGIKQGDKYEPHTEFKDSPVGKIPKSWEVRKLADLIGSLQGGVSVNGENRPKKHSEIGVLKVSAVFKGRFIPSEYKTITKEDEPRARVNPIKGTILFSRANTPELVGESGYIEESVSDLFLPDKLWVLTAKEPNSLDMRWLCYLLNSDKIRKMITDVATGSSSSMKNISKVSLLSLEFAMPSCKNEQVEISRILHSIDIKLNKTEQKLLRTSNLKKALMQDLLTGKVRVKLDNDSVV
ncbi:restriction endonuclease subunit S [Shewanella baltica]|uniref:restriction endonuclease subunit S n=1 Tax=Shewanella baltica TaxID=62322 RepID=UPI003D7A229E